MCSQIESNSSGKLLPMSDCPCCLWIVHVILFARNSLHFFCSTVSLRWVSRIKLHMFRKVEGGVKDGEDKLLSNATWQVCGSRSTCGRALNRVCCGWRGTKSSCLSFNDAPRVIQKFLIKRAEHSMAGSHLYRIGIDGDLETVWVL